MNSDTTSGSIADMMHTSARVTSSMPLQIAAIALAWLFCLPAIAGDLIGDERRTPPCFHADHTWIEADWEAGAWSLPVVPTT